MQADLDSLPLLTPRQAYLAMLEFLRAEFELTPPPHTVHLGGLLAELEPTTNGSSGDPGGVETFAKAVQKILASDYNSAWSGDHYRA